MEIYKRKILLESLIDRNAGITYGEYSASTYSINFFLTQSINDLGINTDVEYNTNILYPLTISGFPNLNNPLVDKLIESGITFPFMFSEMPVPPIPVDSDFYAQGIRITSSTMSRISELKKYDLNSPYEVGFIFNSGDYIDFQGNLVHGISTIFDLTPNFTGYSFDANNDSNLGTDNQVTGFILRDTNELGKHYDSDINTDINYHRAKISYIVQGWNQTNTTFCAITKEEKFLNKVSPPEIQSEVFIERGANSVLESHFRLSEIESLEHLENYNNGGYYKIEKQTL